MNEFLQASKKRFLKQYPTFRPLLAQIPFSKTESCALSLEDKKKCCKAYIDLIILILLTKAEFESNSTRGSKEVEESNFLTLSSVVENAVEKLFQLSENSAFRAKILLCKDNVDLTETEEVYEAKLDISCMLQMHKLFPTFSFLHWKTRDAIEDLAMLCLYEIC